MGRIVATAFAFVIATVPGFVDEAFADEAFGPVCVLDGDTLHVNGERTKVTCVGGTKIRLRGVDAPELTQTCQSLDGREFRCGQFAAAFLLDRVKGRDVICEGDMRAPGGLLLASCREAGEDLGAFMVGSGWAVADRRYSLKFVKLEEKAKAEGKGLWGMRFVAPDRWRNGERLAN